MPAYSPSKLFRKKGLDPKLFSGQSKEFPISPFYLAETSYIKESQLISELKGKCE